MRFEEMTAEQIKCAKKCDTHEERQAFVEAEGIELTDEQLEGIAGGKQGRKVYCPQGGDHNWVKTGNTRPGKFFGNTWPDEEERCTKCGKTQWVW